jgi:cytochrome c biogenesis protein CcmG/thiol:disulfide interchange protein DsbE
VTITVVGLVAAFALGGGSSRPSSTGTSFDPLTAKFETFEGTKASLADYRGMPVVVNFFAAWCSGCYSEMPGFQQVYERLGDKVRFVGLDVQDPQRDGEAIVASTGVTYITGRDPDGRFVTAFGATGMPTTVLIDKTGKVIEVASGAMSPATLEAKIRQELLG